MKKQKFREKKRRMKFSSLLNFGLIEAFGDMEKTSIGIPKIGTDVTMKCEGLF